MDFLRAVLELPVPEVLAYSKTSDNPVGAEYILMERLEGESSHAVAISRLAR